MKIISKCLATRWEEGLVPLKSSLFISIMGVPAAVNCHEIVASVAQTKVD